MEDNNLMNWITLFVIILHWIIISCQTLEGEFDNHRFIIAVLLPINQIEYENYAENIIRREKISDDMMYLMEAANYAKDIIEETRGSWYKGPSFFTSNVTLDIVFKDHTDFPRFGVNQTDPKLFEELSWLGDWIKNKEGLPCSKNGTKTSHLVGIIYSENNKIKFQTILQSFPLVPRISYSGPPNEMPVNENIRLERGGESRTFNTVSSANLFIIDVVFELLKRNNWTYIAVLHSTLSFQGIPYETYEGTRYTKKFQDLATDHDICIAHIIDTESVLRIMGSKKALWEVIEPYNRVQVIICICNEMDLILLQNALIGEGNGNKKYVVIGVIVDGVHINTYFILNWSWRPDLVHMNMIIPRRIFIKEYRDYFKSRTVQNNRRNPWFKEFWEDRFACKFEPANEEKKCNGKELATTTYRQNPNIPNMIKSVFTLAYGLNKTLSSENWNTYPNFWIKMSNYTNKINFNFLGDEVSFTQDGLPRTELFEICNWNESFTSVLHFGRLFVPQYVSEGVYWRSGYYYDLNQKNIQQSSYFRRTIRADGTLRMNDSITNFPFYIRSTCSDLCPSGYATIKQNDTCCWECDPCDSTEILNNPSICTKCEPGNMSNENKTACIPIPIRKAEWFDIKGLISTLFSLLCITMTVFTSGVFIKYRDTPAVKSTTRELCHVMFGGMILANVTPLISIFTTSLNAFTCGVIRLIPAISFTMIYAALLVKTNRIARLLAMSKKKFPNLNPKFMTLRAQIIITFGLIGIELIICLISLYFHQPKSIIDYKEENDTWIGLETCNLNENILIETFVFIVFLVVLCTNYAIKTRNLPENFNEAKYIGFAMYATILTGMAFALVYFNSEKKMLAINLCVSINSSAILIFLFIPKLYIILWKPEKNTKENFVITADIRSYQGNKKISNSNKQHSKDFKLKQLERKANHAISLNEQVHRSITVVVTELSRVLDTNAHVTKAAEKDESEDSQNVNNSQKTYAQMIEKVKLCHEELNRLKKEVAQPKEESQGHVNVSFVNQE